MTFAGSISCKSGRHCRPCRDFAGGRQWRYKVMFTGDLTPDWPCPDAHPWGYIPPPRASTPLTPYDSARRQIATLDPKDPAGKFLRAISAQIDYLLRERRGGSCSDRRAYAARLRRKLVYYYETYAQAVPPPCNSPA